jgi:DNA replication protein DnaC
MDFSNFPSSLSQATKAASDLLPPNTYIDIDGLVHCSRCHDKRQTYIEWPDYKGPQLVWCVCSCSTDFEQARKLKEIHNATVKKSLSITPADVSIPGWRQINLQNLNLTKDPWSKIITCANNIKRLNREGMGFLLFGQPGCGKTTAAIYIAQSAEKSGLTALATSPTRIVNDMLGGTTKGKNALIDKICQFDLVIIDDFGSERSSEYSQEQLFCVMDALYTTKTQLIVSTNLGLSELKSPYNTTKSRLYSRVVERCRPIAFPTQNIRLEKSLVAQQEALALFNQMQ